MLLCALRLNSSASSRVSVSLAVMLNEFGAAGDG